MFLNNYSVRLICRIASTPEIKTYDNGQKKRCFFDASVNIGKTSDGEFIDRFVTLTFWGRDAEFIARYPKGHRIMVEGTEDYFVPIDRTTGSPKMITDQNGNEKIQVKPQVSVTAWLSLDPINNQNNSNNSRNTPQNNNVGNNSYQQNSGNRQGYQNNQRDYSNQQGINNQQAVPPANMPQQRKTPSQMTNPPTQPSQQYTAPPASEQPQKYQNQGGMPYDNGMAYYNDEDDDLPF